MKKVKNSILFKLAGIFTVFMLVFLNVVPVGAKLLTPKDERADLSVTLVSAINKTHTGNIKNPYVGDHLVYTLEAKNLGPHKATNLTFEIMANGGLYVDHAMDITDPSNKADGIKNNDNLIKWIYTGEFNNNATKTYEMEVIVQPKVIEKDGSQYDFTAIVDSDTFDGYPGDNGPSSFSNNTYKLSGDSGNAITPQEAVDLKVTKTSNFETAKIGHDNVIFTINVLNQVKEKGLSDAKKVKVVDTLPKGFDIESVKDISDNGVLDKTNRIITWDIPEILNGKSKDVSFSVGLNNDVYNLVESDYTNTAVANADPTELELNTLDNTSSITQKVSYEKGIKIEKSSDKVDARKVGDEIKYSFKITNTGVVVLHNVVLNDGPLGIENMVIDVKGGLKPNESVTYEKTLKVTTAYVGGIINTAKVSAECKPNDKVEASDSLFIDVLHDALVWVGDHNTLAILYAGLAVVGSLLVVVAIKRRKSEKRI